MKQQRHAQEDGTSHSPNPKLPVGYLLLRPVWFVLSSAAFCAPVVSTASFQDLHWAGGQFGACSVPGLGFRGGQSHEGI